MMVFKTFDVDKSGTIDAHELTAVAAELGLNMNMTDIQAMIKDLDFNGDGLISPSEF
jgi:Ca2+-binding EF-hand superfamily protein